MSKFSKRFTELEEEMERIGGTLHTVQSPHFGSSEQVDTEALAEWKVKAKNLLVKVCGRDSEHYQTFIEVEKPGGFSSSYSIYKRVRSVFRAAKDDFEGGYLISVKSLVQAEVFESELEQAAELLSGGYKLAAAVIAGVVLETGLRELCNSHNFEHGKLDKMNADLAKQGVYNKLQQKRITALADIRNNAAHGKPDEFSEDDVALMIRDIEQFLAQYLPD